MEIVKHTYIQATYKPILFFIITSTAFDLITLTQPTFYNLALCTLILSFFILIYFICQIMNTRNGKQENIRAGQLRNILRKTSESKTGQEINRERSSTTTTKNNTKKNNNTEPPRTHHKPTTTPQEPRRGKQANSASRPGERHRRAHRAHGGQIIASIERAVFFHRVEPQEQSRNRTEE